MIAVFVALALITYLLLLFLLLRKPGLASLSRRGLFAYILLAFGWTLAWALLTRGWFGLETSALARRIPDYGLLLLALAFHQLSGAFLQRPGPGRRWWALGLGWLLVTVALREDVFGLQRQVAVAITWQEAMPALGLALLGVGAGLFMVRAGVLTLKAYQTARQPLHRNRYRYWLLTLALVVAGAVLHLARLEPWGIVAQYLGTLSAAYLMFSYRLPDARGIARAGAAAAITVLLTVIIYPAGYVLIDTVFQRLEGYTPFVAGAAMALVVAVAFGPMLRLVQRWINRLTAGTEYDSGLTVREYSASISNILDLELLAEVVVRLTGQSLGVTRGTLLMVRQGIGEAGERGFRLEPVGADNEQRQAGELASDSPLAQAFQERSVVTQYDVDLIPRFRGLAEVEREWIGSLQADILVPICTQETWIGLLALGPKDSGDPYYHADLLLLGILADQTAVALENARLVDDLQARHEENLRLTEQLRAANQELTLLDQAKSDFIDIVSHELRTPLTLVRGYNDILRELMGEGTLTPKLGHDISLTVHEAALRLEQIVSTMLDVSLIDSETLALKLGEVSLSDAMGPVTKSWGDALRRRNLSLTVQGLEELPAIWADRSRLERVFSCLLQNAIKFTPDGGHVRITGTLLDTHLPPEERAVQVVVADTGIGIATDNLERIFEKFFRVGDILLHSSGDTKFKGAGPGLGLTLARGIVQAHGGYVWAESAGQDEQACPGSEFYVVLPVRPPAVQPVGTVNATAPASPAPWREAGLFPPAESMPAGPASP